MTDQLISFETAKLAKEKGFIEPVRFNYYDNGIKPFIEDNLKATYPSTPMGEWNANMNKAHNGGIVELYSAPTQSLLQKWLREEHYIYLFVENILVDSSIVNIYMYQHALTSDLIEEDSEDDIIFDTYEEALEQGLQEALKLIK